MGRLSAISCMTNVTKKIVSLLAGLCIGRDFELLEPDEGKLSRLVFRGESGSNTADLLDRRRDLEQRRGRIVRQGNNNSEVDIYRYVTEGTFDSYLYQMVENKRRFISQVFTSKSPARVMQEIDEASLNYAEIKRLEERIAGYKKDMTQVKTCTAPVADGISVMKIGDVSYTDKKEAGTALIETCKQMSSPEPKYMGCYRGFEMYLSFEIISREYRITLKNELSHSVSLGADIHGNDVSI